MNPAILHVIGVAVALAAYVVLTIAGHDGNPVFIFMGGQGAGALTQFVSSQTTNSGTQTPVAIPQAEPRSTIGN